VLFGINSSQRPVGIDDNFFQLGGHSLKAVIMLSKIHRELNVKVTLAEIFRTPTVKGLADFVRRSLPDRHTAIEPAEKKEYYVLSSAQKRLYILQQIDWQSTAYNMPEVIRLGETPDLQGLEATFQRLTERHESLRTSFHLLEDQPVQKVHAMVSFKVEERTGEPVWNPAPFDLSKAPLLRAMFLKTPQNQYYLMVDMHHIISDGISHAVLRKDFMALYQGRLLPSLKIQYKDFTEWQNSEKEKENLNRQESYWLKTFPGEIPVLEIATDFSRPTVQVFEGNVLSFGVGPEETRALKELALKEGATLFMVLLSLYNVFLARLSGQEDIIIGTPTAGRRHADLEPVIGVFINTLALRNYPGGEKSFNEFLREVKEGTIDAFENQDYPFEDLVEKIATTRDASRNPIFDVMLVLQNMDIDLEPAKSTDRPAETVETDKPGIEQRQFLMGNQTSKFDMILIGSENQGGTYFSLEYSTRLFKGETIERFLTYLKSILTAVLANPHLKISEIEILSVAEKRKILVDFNDTKAEYLQDKTVNRLIEEQVERTPDKIAIIGPATSTVQKFHSNNHESPLQITYREMNVKCNRLAKLLRQKGMAPNVTAGVMIKRSVEAIVGIFSILKSGGTYLPIDLSYPLERKRHILRDCNARLAITDGSVEGGEILPCEIINVKEGELFRGEVKNHRIDPGPDGLIYIIFTSGSTGLPKGSGVYHRGFANLMCWYMKEFDLNSNDRMQLLTSLSFDLTQKNIYASFLIGGTLYITLGEYFEPQRINQEIYKNQLTRINCTPGMFYKLLEEEKKLNIFSSLRYVFLGGESIKVEMLRKLYESGKWQGQVVNTYGPTECTDVCAYYRIIEWEKYLGGNEVPIGRPIFNIRLYIVDRFLSMVPVGTAGELCVSGKGVGVGYINRVEMTWEKFVKCFFLEGPGEKCYRTGDLARWLWDGNIEFLGRIDQQIKIRGLRVELGEIVNRLLNVHGVKEAVVLIREEMGDDKYICAYFVSERKYETSELRDYLSKDLPEYMIPSYFVPIDKIPLTPNGKVDRKALPEPGVVSGKSYIAPRDIVEEKLAAIWGEVLLGINSSQAPVGIDDNFFQMGGHSLKAVIMLSKVHRELNVNVPLAEIFRTPTIKGLAEYVRKSAPDRHAAIEPAEKKEYYRLSSAQKRLYILQQMDWQSTAYNMPEVIPLGEAPDLQGLEATFKRLIERHESLRTSFHLLEDQPVQKVHPTVVFKVEERIGEHVWNPGPFDLAKAPLLRAICLKTQQNQYYLMVDMHHIISDG
ncbi:MAG TPA: amino acid adenylation domain-containing protein, partial [Candidatus Deferrimicrobium sp.]|nr:amino acid adenylation domain-containing protein [Candidatus Deferrimicrobium sp.]